jgi:hypothetical protein
MKLSYCAAPSKQEKMVITKEIVTFMQSEYGSRFLKMEGGNWVEINNQAARDKVSHALRFAARNLKKSESKTAASVASSKSSTTTRRSKKRKTRKTQDGDESVSSTSEPSASSESDDEAPIPLSQIFDHTFETKPQIFSPLKSLQNAFGLTQTNDKKRSVVPAAEEEAEEPDFGVAATSLSLRSMQLDDACDLALRKEGEQQQQHQPKQPKQQSEPEFSTLRSEDLNDILDEPLDDEWEAVQQLAEC